MAALGYKSDEVVCCSAEAAAVSLGGRRGMNWKVENQDQFLVIPMNSMDIDQPSFVIGVFDGHGEHGLKAARLARKAFWRSLEELSSIDDDKLFSNPSFNEHLMKYLFEDVTSRMDSSKFDFSKSGATAVLCVVNSKWVTSAWVGDSRAVLGITSPVSTSGKIASRAVIPLTMDHKPDPLRCPSEAKRVTETGGRIDRLTTDRTGRPVGPFRVFLKDRWTPGLAVSRSFGDHIGREAGVTPEPDIQSLMINSSHAGQQQISSFSFNDKHKQVIIVATDGLWEWVSSEEAIQIAWEAETASDAVQALAELARKHWALKFQGRVCDDITIVAFFMPIVT